MARVCTDSLFVVSSLRSTDAFGRRRARTIHAQQFTELYNAALEPPRFSLSQRSARFERRSNFKAAQSARRRDVVPTIQRDQRSHVLLCNVSESFTRAFAWFPEPTDSRFV